MTAWLREHPPARPQYRSPRREDASGVVVLHSAENVPDLKPPDTGAEAVAKFIQARSDPGSYHWICDADSRILLVEYGDEAFGDGTGSNRHAIHISGAFRAEQWFWLPEDYKAAVVEQMAAAALNAGNWLAAHGVDLPARRITRSQSEAREPGFITHAERDPARRTDPGEDCARRVVARYGELIAPPLPPTEEDDLLAAWIMAVTDAYHGDHARTRNPRLPDRADLDAWALPCATDERTGKLSGAMARFAGMCELLAAE